MDCAVGRRIPGRVTCAGSRIKPGDEAPVQASDGGEVAARIDRGGIHGQCPDDIVGAGIPGRVGCAINRVQPCYSGAGQASDAGEAAANIDVRSVDGQGIDGSVGVGIPACVRRAVRIQPGHVAAGKAVQQHEIAAKNELSVGLSRYRKDGAGVIAQLTLNAGYACGLAPGQAGQADATRHNNAQMKTVAHDMSSVVRSKIVNKHMKIYTFRAGKAIAKSHLW